ncbi:FecCD family ABC transporter permease [Cysteiniphilum halobium]|uniref:FecCD family ABC transporter permease n=1 Tax=Cysteiniphilum halobium TaxID=2219059 RepID=UPI000E65744E|nr:iron ABC transporter permease [Cysteiniphilum halobium]
MQTRTSKAKQTKKTRKINRVVGFHATLSLLWLMLFIIVSWLSYGQSAHLNSVLASQLFWQYQLIIWAAATLVGGGLGVSGAILQLVLRNPLADASILGISSGSQFVGLMLLFILPAYFVALTHYSYLLFFLACVFGAFIVLIIFLLVISLQDRLANIAVVILLGVGVSAIFSALTALIMSFSQAQTLQQITLWQFGGFVNVTWQQVILLAIITLIFCGFVYCKHQAFDLLSLGESEAMMMGLNVKRLLVHLVVLLAFLIAAIVSVAGPIAFLGLVAPHIARMCIGTNKMKYLFMSSFLCGAILMLISQFLSQTLLYPMIIPVGVITALIGAPFLIFLVIRALAGK